MSLPRAALVLLLAVPAAGCGGDKQTEATTGTVSGPRLSQSQFVSSANAVCIAADRRVFRIGSLSREPGGWDKTARAAERGIAEMRNVRPPAAADAGFARMLTLAGGLQHEVAAVGAALHKHDFKAAQAAQLRATAADTKVKKQAQKLGLTFCGQLLTNWPA